VFVQTVQQQSQEFLTVMLQKNQKKNYDMVLQQCTIQDYAISKVIVKKLLTKMALCRVYTSTDPAKLLLLNKRWVKYTQCCDT